MKAICFTDEYDSKEIKEANADVVFIDDFKDLIETNADFYLVSLKKASTRYDEFTSFMRSRPMSKFLFLEEYHQVMTNEDFTIRDEPNTDIYMYTPDKAMFLSGLIN
jgi:hypothetical protein